MTPFQKSEHLRWSQLVADVRREAERESAAQAVLRECYNCDGTGLGRLFSTCISCGGEGRIEEEE